MFKIRKTDMSPNHSTFILDSANIIKERETSQNKAVFLSDLKHILDSRFGGDWNLLAGRTVGYAMKTRKKASVVLSDESKDLLICWRSPGFEVEDLDVVKIKTNLALSEEDRVLVGQPTSKLKVIASPEPDSAGYTPETPAVLRILEAISDDVKDMTHDTAARYIRSHLTARLGTIWHVAVGLTGEFEIQCAKSCTDHIVAVTKKGLKIEVFRHKALEPSGLSTLSVPSFQTVMDITPTILFVFLCVAFLVQKSAICIQDMQNKTLLTKSLCYVTTSFSLTPLALVLFVMTIVKQVKKSIQQKRLNKKSTQRR